MKRLSETDLGGHASRAAREHFGDSIKGYDIVKISLVLNAYVAGFWAGARHAETHDGNVDPRPKWRKRAFFWERWPKVAQLADMMSAEYHARFPSLSAEDGALVLSASRVAFSKGWRFRVTYDDAGSGQGQSA